MMRSRVHTRLEASTSRNPGSSRASRAVGDARTLGCNSRLSSAITLGTPSSALEPMLCSVHGRPDKLSMERKLSSAAIQSAEMCVIPPVTHGGGSAIRLTERSYQTPRRPTTDRCGGASSCMLRNHVATPRSNSGEKLMDAIVRPCPPLTTTALLDSCDTSAGGAPETWARRSLSRLLGCPRTGTTQRRMA